MKSQVKVPECHQIQTEIPEGMTLSVITYNLMRRMEKSGAVTFEIDDGPDGIEAVKQLLDICECHEYMLIKAGIPFGEVFIGDDGIDSGCYTLLDPNHENFIVSSEVS